MTRERTADRPPASWFRWVPGRRFVAVGAIATIVDLAVFWAFAIGSDNNWVAADVGALVAAALVAHGLHRVVTLKRSPYVRWLHMPAAALGVVAIATVVDVATLAFAFELANVSLFGAKVIAVAVAAAVRLCAYRWLLFRVVRSDTSSPGHPPFELAGSTISVVVPAYREADRIGDTIARLRTELAGALGPIEIVVVDDGSGDGTAAAAAAADRVVVLPENRGKGAAVRAGMVEATGDIVTFTDADLAYPPAQLIPLVEQIAAGYDVAVGTRQHTDSIELARAGSLRTIGGRGINVLTQIVLLGQYRDTQCGVKAFRRSAADRLFRLGRVDGFGFDVELFHLVERYRLSLIEVPATVENTSRSTVHVVRDAGRLIRDLFRIRIWARRGLYEADHSDRW